MSSPFYLTDMSKTSPLQHATSTKRPGAGTAHAFLVPSVRSRGLDPAQASGQGPSEGSPLSQGPAPSWPGCRSRVQAGEGRQCWLSLAAPLLLPGEGTEPPRGLRHLVAETGRTQRWPPASQRLPGPAGSRPLRTMPRSRGSSDSGELDLRPRPGVQAGLPGGARAPGGARHGGDRCSLSVSHRSLLLAPGSTRSGAGAAAGDPEGPGPEERGGGTGQVHEPGRGCAHSPTSTTPGSKEALAQRPGTPGGGTKGPGELVPRAGPGPHVWASESSSRPPLPRRYLARSFRVTSPTTWLRLSTTTKCRRPSARNSLNTRGSDASCGTV